MTRLWLVGVLNRVGETFSCRGVEVALRAEQNESFPRVVVRVDFDKDIKTEAE